MEILIDSYLVNGTSAEEEMFPDVHTALIALSERYKEAFYGELSCRLECLAKEGKHQ